MAERDYVIVQKGAKRSPADEWIHCTLADACSAINYGLTASASSRSDGPKFLRITDIVSGSPNWSTVPHVEADDDTIAKYRLHDGDIVIARTGASTGTSAYVSDPHHPCLHRIWFAYRQGPGLTHGSLPTISSLKTFGGLFAVY